MINYLYFPQIELQCRCGCGVANMHPDFMQKLIALREYLNFSLPITSGYRCAKHNQKISGTGENGPHTTGRAVDIALYGEKAFILITAAKQFGFTGIGLKQHGPHAQRYIHLDDLALSRPMVWTYS